MPKRRSQQGYVLVFSVLTALVLAILMQAAYMRGQIELENSDVRLAAQQAFYAAENGVERALTELRQNPAWRPGTSGFAAVIDQSVRVTDADAATTVGFYSLTVAEVAGSSGPIQSVWIRSEGSDTEKKYKRTILSKAAIVNPAAFFVSTPGDLKVKSGANFTFDILANNVFFEVDSDPALSEDDRKISVQDVYFQGDVIGEENESVEHGKLEPIESMTYPGVDLPRYCAMASGCSDHVPDNSTTVINLDTDDLQQYNGVIFAKGNVRVSGNLSSSRMNTNSLAIVAGGNIYIDDNTTTTADVNGRPRPQLGLLAKKDVVIPSAAPDDLNLHAFLMADGGRFIAEKDGGEKGTLTFFGAMAMRGQGAQTAADLDIYKTRDYTFDPTLRFSNFLPSSAQVNCSEERKAQDSFPPTDGYCQTL